MTCEPFRGSPIPDQRMTSLHLPLVRMPAKVTVHWPRDRRRDVTAPPLELKVSVGSTGGVIAEMSLVDANPYRCPARPRVNHKRLGRASAGPSAVAHLARMPPFVMS